MEKKTQWDEKILEMQKETDLIVDQLRERKEFFQAIREKTELLKLVLARKKLEEESER